MSHSDGPARFGKPAESSRPASADTPTESVVLLDEGGRAVGAADKQSTHHGDTPLHLAFSCYLFDDAGNVLVTQRALDKQTWPGVWTNSCCGHPGPGEAITGAVHRRARHELGTEIAGLRLLLPGFRYRAEMNGVVENEMCPVFAATAIAPINPHPDEVAEAIWEPWTTFRTGVLDGTREISPWCREQVALLPADPLSAPAAAAAELPPAARR